MTSTGRVAFITGTITGATWLYNSHLDRQHASIEAELNRQHTNAEAAKNRAFNIFQEDNRKWHQSSRFTRAKNPPKWEDYKDQYK